MRKLRIIPIIFFLFALSLSPVRSLTNDSLDYAIANNNVYTVLGFASFFGAVDIN